jgi:hypothetical protein
MKHPRTPAPSPARETADSSRVLRDRDGKPDLTRLIKRWGGHDRIPADAWRDYNEAMRIFHERRRDRFVR